MLRLLLDPYEQRARLVPGMIAVLPVMLVVGTVLWSVDAKAAAAAVVLAEISVPVAISNHTRRAGKAIERDLWASWGGPPTVRRLRHSADTNPHRLALAHASLRRIAPEVALPERTDEEADPVDADRRYDAAAEVARNRLRYAPEGRLLFAENCSYGYHRNLLGIRPVGIRVAVVSNIAASALLGASVAGWVAAPPAALLLLLTVNVSLLLFWAFVPCATDVERAADGYAETFVGVLAALPPACGPDR